MSDLKNDLVLTIRGKTEEECKKKLDKKYNTNYEIMGIKAVTLNSFFGFIKNSGVELRYIERDKPKFDYLEALNRQNEYQQEMQNQLNRQKLQEQNRTQPILESIQPQLDKMMEKMLFMEASVKQTNPSPFDTHPTIQKVQSFLEKNEFSPSFCNTMIQKIRAELSLSDLENYTFIHERLIDWISESFLIKKPFYEIKPQIIMLVGPTGVGKTTTIAKIAAHLTVLDVSRIKTAHIITIDKVRIAAIDQIEAYGKHMDITVSVAKSQNEFRNQIDKYAASVDYIFIDTVGASPNDTNLLLSMKDIVYLRENHNFLTYLTLSASTKHSDMKEIMASYDMFSYDSLIITKMDETKSVGNIISVLSDTQKPVTYFTTGQSVPRNIEMASVSKLISYLEPKI